MANPGAGSKYVSVNLNKSYGQQHQQNHHNNQYNHGQGRGWPGVAGGGGGMVVLSRPRSSQKATGPKLSEHERFDSLGSGGGHGSGGPGNGLRPSSSGMGWSKPAAIVVQEKEGLDVSGVNNGAESGNNYGGDQGVSNGVNKLSTGSSGGVYMPPTVRSVELTVVSDGSRGYSVANKVWKGEDFPSLQATLSSVSGPEKKQKDGLNQKQKQVLSEELVNEQRDGFGLSRVAGMRPQMQARNTVGNGLDEDGVDNQGLGHSVTSKKEWKQQEYFASPLPLVRLNPRSDWADDEWDTRHGLTDRGKDHGFPKDEAYWDRDFDFPRPSVLPQKPAHNPFDRRGQHGNETGKISSSEVTKVDTYGRDVRTPSREGREGKSWRASSPLTKDKSITQEAANGIGVRPPSFNRETVKENRYIPSALRVSSQDDAGRRDVGYGQGGKQPWRNTMDSFGNRGPDRNTREYYGSEQYNRYRGDTYQNNSFAKSSFSVGGKGLSINDPILNFGREKRPFSKSEKPHVEDPFMKDFGTSGFDGWDPFSGSLVGLVKKKKDVLKQTDFHDPVRESFEAELERVQKMQELERHLRRRGKMRLAREQEERQRRLEEETKEAEWRAEQERLEAIRREEEHKIAREEEKQRIFMEEERRKQGARQKLLELEEKIARRQAEAARSGNGSSSGVTDEIMTGMVTEKDVSRVTEVADWEESERMVESITASVSSDSSAVNRPSEIASRSHFSRDGSSAFSDRGEHVNSWKRDILDNVNTRAFSTQDASVGGRPFSRKEFYGGPGLLPPRPYIKGGIPDPQVDDFSPQFRSQRWNISGDGDYFGRNSEIESDFQENFAERFADSAWGNARTRGKPDPQYHDRMYQHYEADSLYSFGRSRYPMRQPRVLPPPSIASLHRNPYRGENERSGPSTFPESEMQSNHGARNDSTMQARYDSSYQENLGRAETIAQLENTEIEVQNPNTNTTRCDSQSSLSVSSPPDSPAHLSNDLNESGDSPVLLAGEGKDALLLGQENESVSLPTETNKEKCDEWPSIVSDGEDGEWAVENGEQLQEQEEYDEDEDGYEEEDEVHDGEDENINLTQNLEDMHLDEECAPDMMESLVLGFNEGVEVGMPNDDFERSSGNEEIKFVIPKPSEEQGSFDATCSYGQTLQHVDGSTLVNLDNSTRIFQETQKAIQSKNSSQTSALPEHMDHSDASTNHCLSIQPQIQLSSDQTAMSTIPSASNQPEVPVKLQFGLFSGPSLIPSPMPLHLHPPVGPSFTHIHPSQPPLFQFGQLRYTSPIPPGVLPLNPQSMSLVQPDDPSNVSSNHSIGVAVPIKPGQDIVKNDVSSVSMDSQRGLLPRHLDLSHLEVKGDCSHSGNINSRPESCFQAENALVKTFKTVPTRELEHQPQTGEASSLSVSKEKGLGVSKGPGLISSGRGRRYVFCYRDFSHRFQWISEKPRRLRTEFRVRENSDKKQSAGSEVDDKSNISGGRTGARSGSSRVVFANRHPKHIPDSEGSSSRPVSLQEIDSRSKVEKVAGKESVRKIQNISHSREDVDAPLQSGIVRVFEQPGIEAPSDDDDFIEVRSKRQMLNDRREQRQKEIKAKSRVSKMPRKPRPYSQSASVSSISNKNYPPVGGEASNSIRSDFVVPEGHGLANIEVSAGFNAPIVSQPLPPIGTPAVKTEIQAVKSFHTSSLTSVSGGGKNHASGLIFDGKNNVLETVQTSLGSWGRSRINQQVMTLAQTQLDEAMKPVQFDSHSSVGDPTNSVSEPSVPSSSLLCKDKSFSSAGSPINSLLAGEKIQFGGHLLSCELTSCFPRDWPPSLCQSDIHISHNLSASESDCSLFFEKEKPSNETCAHLEDCEAEAAASAVAVAAISSDEIGGNVLGAGHVSVSDSKNFGGADLDSISAGASADQQIASQSRVEESLSLALPADLSVDTPISLWPPLPIPQNSESQMLSHMNPMLGGPIFAFGPHDESTPTQSQSQKSNASVSGPLGAWQQHSAVDSFYGPPAGFTGPFISPPGSIPGVQVGLSYMGSTYIPSGKQPDWKHNHVSSAMSGEGDMNMVSSQRNPTNMPAIQHLAPGSPLLPLASPVAMYDVSPFQSSDISVQARWPHVPASPLQSLPVSKPLQQAEVPPSHFNHSLPVDQTLTATRFSESGTATPDNRQDFPAATYATVSQLPDELRLVDSITTSVGISTQSTGAKSSSASTISEAGKIDGMQNDRASSGSGQNSSSALKTKPSHQKNTSAQHYNNSAGYNYQRGGGGSQKNSSGAEWSHRRTAYQGRNQTMGIEKNYPLQKQSRFM
ncbi:protein WYRD [Salix suchowensis]|nr:protein WYRD [Salix suchowensis]